MFELNWIPAISSTALLAAALWLARNLIHTRLAKAVEHDFNTKLENLKAELRDSEERLKADLRAREAEISALRGGAMTAMASRQVAVDKRRLKAVDQLWSTVIALGPTRMISSMMAVIKFEEAAKHAERDPKARQFFETIGGGLDTRTLDFSGAAKARPFVSITTWAAYSAFMAVCMHSVMRWNILRFGVEQKDFVDNDAISKLIKAALPHYGDYVDKVGPSGFHYVIEALEEKLLQEIRLMLAGVESDRASIEQAAEILKRASEVASQASTTQPAA